MMKHQMKTHLQFIYAVAILNYTAKPLAKNKIFKLGMLKHAEKGTFIFGECGGFMTLDKPITDKNNVEHKMLGLLDLKHRSLRKNYIYLIRILNY